MSLTPKQWSAIGAGLAAILAALGIWGCSVFATARMDDGDTSLRIGVDVQPELIDAVTGRESEGTTDR
jgi:hypothetical protein